jgi:hypothetical protein
MPAYSLKSTHLQRYRGSAIYWIAFSFLSLLVCEPRVLAAQTAIPGSAGQQEIIGRLSGDDVSVKGAISFDAENGRSTAMLASGSELTLRSGQAKIDLVEGGDIILCGPAHLSILKSGLAVTIALDYGQVHLQVGTAAQVTLYTPSVIVVPVAIGDGMRDVTVGLDQNGALCAMALSGAVRMAQQFTGESLIVPQGGDIQVDGGKLQDIHGGSRKCTCELLVSRSAAPRESELSAQSHSSPISPKVTPSDAPTYRIDMPPLTFDASSPAPAPILAADAILLIRESVQDQAITFQGAVKPALPPPPAERSRSAARSRSSKPRLLAKLFGIFRWL